VHDEESWQEWLAGDPLHTRIGPVDPEAIEWLTDVTDCTCGQEIWRRAGNELRAERGTSASAPMHPMPATHTTED
jgi:hypothetical protein